MSKTARRFTRQETDYHWQVFVVRLNDGVLQEPLQNDCAWVAADRIHARFTTEGKSIAEQVYRVLQAVENAEFDLFVPYGHADNEKAALTNLIEHIRQEHEQFSPNDPLKIFFDLWKIRDGEDWERRIYRGLIESKTMLAVLSPIDYSATTRWSASSSSKATAASDRFGRNAKVQRTGECRPEPKGASPGSHPRIARRA